MNRRSFFKAASAVPFLKKPLKDALDKEIAEQLIGRDGQALLSGLGAGRSDGQEGPSSRTPIQYRMALAVAQKEIESLLYQGELKPVWVLDIDIANKRSFSMAAKIAYQRQRNVQRYLDRCSTFGDRSPYYWVTDLVDKFIGKPKQ